MRGIGVTAQRRANADQFVSGYGSTDTAATNKYSDLCRAVLNGFTDFFGVIGIIVWNGAVVRAEIDEFMTSSAQLFDYALVKGKPSVIRSDGYLHDDF